MLVEVGHEVERGQTLVILEAMKMEHRVAAPAAGTVTAVHVQAGEQVDDGTILLDLEPATLDREPPSLDRKSGA